MWLWPGGFWSRLATRMTWDREASTPESGVLETLPFHNRRHTSVSVGLVSTLDHLASLKRSQEGRTNPLMSWFSSSSSDPPSSSWILLPSDSLCFLINSLSASASDSLFSTHSKAPSHVWGFGQTKYVLYIIIISHGQACWERVLFYHLPRLGPSFFTVLCTLRFPQAHLRQKSVQYRTKQPTKVAAPCGLPRTTQRMRCKLECKVLGKWRILVHCWVLPWTLSSSPANLNWQHQNNWTIWFTRFHLGFPTATVRRQWFISPLELTLRSSCSSQPF